MARGSARAPSFGKEGAGFLGCAVPLHPGSGAREAASAAGAMCSSSALLQRQVRAAAAPLRRSHKEMVVVRTKADPAQGPALSWPRSSPPPSIRAREDALPWPHWASSSERSKAPVPCCSVGSQSTDGLTIVMERPPSEGHAQIQSTRSLVSFWRGWQQQALERSPCP